MAVRERTCSTARRVIFLVWPRSSLHLLFTTRAPPRRRKTPGGCWRSASRICLSCPGVRGPARRGIRSLRPRDRLRVAGGRVCCTALEPLACGPELGAASAAGQLPSPALSAWALCAASASTLHGQAESGRSLLSTGVLLSSASHRQVVTAALWVLRPMSDLDRAFYPIVSSSSSSLGCTWSSWKSVGCGQSLRRAICDGLRLATFVMEPHPCYGGGRIRGRNSMCDHMEPTRMIPHWSRMLAML